MPFIVLQKAGHTRIRIIRYRVQHYRSSNPPTRSINSRVKSRSEGQGAAPWPKGYNKKSKEGGSNKASSSIPKAGMLSLVKSPDPPVQLPQYWLTPKINPAALGARDRELTLQLVRQQNVVSVEQSQILSRGPLHAKIA